MNLVGLFLKGVHQLHRHHWAGAPLDRWIAVLLVIVAGLMTIRWLPGGLRGVAVCGGLVLLLFLVQSWAERRLYLVFRRDGQPAGQRPGAPILNPMDKLLVRASGLFEVEGKEQTFTELQAYFRSFETREHAVMAIVPPSNFLALGNWPDHEIGMWYMFFANKELRQIEPGRVCFGARERPALRIEVERELPVESSPLDVWGGYRTARRRAKPKTRRATIYLSFDSDDSRQRILDDLAADAAALGGR